MKELNIGQSATLTDFAMCINHYRLSSPGLYVCIHATVQLTPSCRLVPGLLAQVNHGARKQCEPDARYQCFCGPPNFVFDVWAESDRSEYEARREQFQSAGVVEYVVWFDEAPLPIWNRLVDGRFEEVTSDREGMIESKALPGLWIPIESLRARDWWGVMARISQGITRREHHALMDTIWNSG